MQSVWRRWSKSSSLSRRSSTASTCPIFRPGKLFLAEEPRCHRVHSFYRELLSSPRFSSNLSKLRQPERLYRAYSDTIYALSTPPGRAAIAVIRISGPGCVQVYRALCPGRSLPLARTAAVRKLYDVASPSSAGSVIDSAALVLYFPAPNTVTGEDVLELHTHGGPAIVKAVLNAISSMRVRSKGHCPSHNVRYAEAGEFTKRAFYNNRLDLMKVEALSDLLSAETEQQRQLAVNGSNSNLGARYENWRNMLLNARGELEALIDFSEDQHFEELPDDILSSISKQLLGLRREMTLHVHGALKGELLRNGINLALLGAPNAGKSSLMNRIVGREAAIVSSEEGTTRDIVEVSVDIGGWLCRLGDMAGLGDVDTSGTNGRSRSPIGSIEREGMKRAKARALTSDVVLVILALEIPKDSDTASLQVDQALLDVIRDCEKLRKPMIVVINKIDNLRGTNRAESFRRISKEVERLFPTVPSERIFAISCLEPSSHSRSDEDAGNIQTLLRGCQSLFATLTTPSSPGDHHFDKPYFEETLAVSHRQSRYLQHCLHYLDQFTSTNWRAPHSNDKTELDPGINLVVSAEHLRYAADCLAKITGRGEAGDVEAVLGVVFEKFCVGK